MDRGRVSDERRPIIAGDSRNLLFTDGIRIVKVVPMRLAPSEGRDLGAGRHERARR
jgi:hypothetical protein